MLSLLPGRTRRLELLLACVASLLLLGSASSSAAANLVQQENAQPGTAGWARPLAPSQEIEGYAGADSAQPGDQVDLHVRSGPATRYRVEVYRLGWYDGIGARQVLCVPDCQSDRGPSAQPAAPAPDPRTGVVDAGWATSDSFTVGDDWVSGYYLVEFVVTSGPAAGTARWTPLIVRPGAGRDAQVLVQAPVNTWQAYNGWGGKSLYTSNSTFRAPAINVSFNRPYDLDPNLATLFDFDYPLIRFLEREGIDVGYVTDLDVERDPSLLMRSRLAMSAGHDEYWTMNQRVAFQSARDQGTNIAIMGGNAAYWQVRWNEARRTLVAYKDTAWDPIADRSLVTRRFRDVGLPECQLLGVQYGSYANDIDRAYTVTAAGAADPWFAGTGIAAGTVLPESVGYEWDTADWPTDCPSDRTVLLHRDPEARDAPDRAPTTGADATRYTAASGARVFATGSLQFSWLLDGGDPYSAQTYYASKRTVGADPRMQHFMRNALDDLGRPAPPTDAQAQIGAGGVEISVAASPDPRVHLRVLRHRGPDAFSPGDPGVVVACDVAATSCTDGAVTSGIYRYAVVGADEWTISDPVLLDAVNLGASKSGSGADPAPSEAAMPGMTPAPGPPAAPGVDGAVSRVSNAGSRVAGHGSRAGLAAPAVTARPRALSAGRSPRFVFRAAGSRSFECSLARQGRRAAFTRCSSPKRYHGLPNGTYVFRVRRTARGRIATVVFRIRANAHPKRHQHPNH
jgi:hypothetical protein